MPRLPPSIIHRARGISPHLAALLPVCRDLASARNELRWIREHVADFGSLISKPQSRLSKSTFNNKKGRTISGTEDNVVAKLCRRRGRGYPLQYILGSQPFGHLDIKCRPGVLIPRPETEAWVLRLAEVVSGDENEVHDGDNGERSGLNILDLCTGSGCIALLLYSLLQRRFHGLSATGFDVEPKAVALAGKNLAINTQKGLLPGAERNVEFKRADIFSDEWLSHLQVGDVGEQQGPKVDILVSNPPYISSRGFNRDTARSVRNHEPKLALVPLPSISSRVFTDVSSEDVFYARILDVAQFLQPRFTVLEVGDLAQALRVVRMARNRRNGAEVEFKIEIWRDWPDMKPCEDEEDSVDLDGMEVLVRGSGNGRAVFIHRVG